MTPEQHPAGEHPKRMRPQVWVGSLADHNAGDLWGCWIPADRTPEELTADIEAMLAASPQLGAQEYAIFDYDGFGPVHLDEHSPLEDVACLGQGLADHGPPFAHLAALLGPTGRDELVRFEELYVGEWPSVEAYSEQLLEDMDVEGAIAEYLPEWAQPYVRVDTRAMVAIVESEMFVSPSGEGVYVFHYP